MHSGRDLLKSLGPDSGLKKLNNTDQYEKTSLPIKETTVQPGELVLDKEGQLFTRYIKAVGLSAHLIEPYDHWLTYLLPNKLRSTPIFLRQGTLRISDIKLNRSPHTPQYHRDNHAEYLIDILCRFTFQYKDKTDVLDIEYDNQKVPGYIKLCSLPLMLGSRHSHYGEWKKDPLLMKVNLENPDYTGGFFIMKGKNKLINIKQRTRNNQILVYPESKTKGKINAMMTCRMTCPTESSTIVVLLKESKLGSIKLSLPFLGSSGSKQHSVHVLSLLRLLGKYIDNHGYEGYGSLTKIVDKLMALTIKDRNKQNRIRNKLAISIAKADIIKKKHTTNSDDSMEYDYKYIISKLYSKEQRKTNLKSENTTQSTLAIDKMRVMEGIINELFPQVISKPYNPHTQTHDVGSLIQKYEMLCLMIVKLTEVMAGIRPRDDLNSGSNQRHISAAFAMEQLFNSTYRLFITNLQNIDLQKDVITHLKTQIMVLGDDNITKNFYSSFTSPYWGIKSFQNNKASSVMDFLADTNMVATTEHLHRIDTPASRKAMQIDTRALHPTNWGFVGPENTPEGGNCGLLNHLAKTCKYSVQRPEGPLIRRLKGENIFIKNAIYNIELRIRSKEEIRSYGYIMDSYVKDLAAIVTELGLTMTQIKDVVTIKRDDPITPQEVKSVLDTINKGLLFANRDPSHNEKLLINSKFLGWCNGEDTRQFLVNIRRTNVGYNDISIFLENDSNFSNKKLRGINNTLYVYCDGARPIRPLLIYGNGIDPLKSMVDKVVTIKDPVTNKKKNVNVTKYGPDMDKNGIIMTKKGLLIIDQLDGWNLPASELFQLGAMEYVDASEQEYLKIAITNDDLKYENLLKNSVANDLRQAISDYQQIKADPTLKLVRSSIVLSEASTSTQLREEEVNLKSAKDRVLNLQSQLKTLNETVEYTHCELDPGSLFSITGGIIPFITHNAPARVMFQSNMAKQALGVGFEQPLASSKALINTQRSLVETDMHKTLGMDTKPTGQTVIVAFANFGDNVEDAIIMKKSSLERGLFMNSKYTLISEKINSSIGEIFSRPLTKQGTSTSIYENIDQNGIPKVGSVMVEGQCIIGKTSKTDEGASDTSRYINVGEEGIIERVILSPPTRPTIIDVLIRETRIPVLGDKFAPRMSQKGTVAKIVNDEDMMFIQTDDDNNPMNGVKPDIIFNTHGIPTRMTPSMLYEVLVSSLAANTGQRYNASNLRYPDLVEIQKMMASIGMTNKGLYSLVDGVTGKELNSQPGVMTDSQIYVGPIYYQMLKHHVLDKIQARDTIGGRRDPTTRQPVGGRSMGGAIRFGEMERDSLAGHGAPNMLLDRLCGNSDEVYLPVCLSCGTLVINDVVAKTYSCQKCHKSNNLGIAKMTYSWKVLTQLMGLGNILPTMKFEKL